MTGGRTGQDVPAIALESLISATEEGRATKHQFRWEASRVIEYAGKNGGGLIALRLLCVPAVVAVVYFWPGEYALDGRVRWAGMLLQLAGLGFVIKGLIELQKVFNQGVSQLIRARLLRFKHIFFPPPPLIISATGLAAGSSRMSGHATLSVNRSDATTEERIEQLETRLQDLTERVASERQEERKRWNEFDAQLSTERQARQRDSSDVKHTVEKATIGGVGLEFVGVVYLFFGIILATTPELAVYIFGILGL